MPKAMLTFNLPEEKEDFIIAQKGIDRLCALDDISNNIFRSARKYHVIQHNGKQLTEEQVAFVGELEEAFHAILREHDL